MSDAKYNRVINRRMLRLLGWLARRFVADLRDALGGLR